jgi:hypothetical protein
MEKKQISATLCSFTMLDDGQTSESQKSRKKIFAICCLLTAGVLLTLFIKGKCEHEHTGFEVLTKT